jgi:hypothetical protein
MCLLMAALSLIALLVVALRGTRMSSADSDVSAREVANYATERFACEPDLWRVHLRTIRSLSRLIESKMRQCDEAAQVLRAAESFFLMGLFSVGIALGTLAVAVTF